MACHDPDNHAGILKDLRIYFGDNIEAALSQGMQTCNAIDLYHHWCSVDADFAGRAYVHQVRVNSWLNAQRAGASLVERGVSEECLFWFLQDRPIAREPVPTIPVGLAAAAVQADNSFGGGAAWGSEPASAEVQSISDRWSSVKSCMPPICSVNTADTASDSTHAMQTVKHRLGVVTRLLRALMTRPGCGQAYGRAEQSELPPAVSTCC